MFIPQSKYKFLLTLFSVLLLCGVVVYLLVASRDVKTSDVVPERASLSGIYECVPTRTSAPADASCVEGVRTDEGKYYAVDFGLMSQTRPSMQLGERITASGVLTPIEMISSDYWRHYTVAGIFSVTDSLRVVLSEPVVVPEVSELRGEKWVWIQTEYMDGTVLAAPASSFVFQFTSDGNIQSTTDCNSLGGSVVVDGEVISFGPFVSTMMYCEDSKEGVYAADLALTSSYTIVGTELRLNLNRDYGTMVFHKMEGEL